ncbi:putative acylesterase/phospholipase RssA, partial [Undibacterium sp. GrIS 1.2]
SHVPLQTRKPIATVATPMLDFTGLGILQEAQTEQFNLPVFGSLLLMTYIPVSLFVITVVRRPLLRKLKIAMPDASETRLFEQAIRQLFGLLLTSTFVFLFLIFGTESLTRTIGSGAIAMLSCTSALLLLGLLTLCFRRLDHYIRGFVLTGGLALSVVYVILHAQFGWSPLKEISGKEVIKVLKVPPEILSLPQFQIAKTQDIIVNAYGGGIRAGLFTAKLLARVDDMSCGEFGQKLDRLSGVSGGSLGIAIYATLRQEYVASGGWPADCKKQMPRLPNLEPLVSEALLQDHLSPILARMMSIDLVPGITPQRGQALLNSWQDATKKVLMNLKSQRVPNGSNAISLLALAKPITKLTAGVIPAPKIYFNSTDSGTGQRLWLSNTGNRGDGLQNKGELAPEFQVGMAALHSARFPLVSPSGSFPKDDGTYKLVDGGYADNSGAETLRATGNEISDAHKNWINIDGNPPVDYCPTLEKAKKREVWSGLNALFAIREAQAGLAVGRLESILKDTYVDIDLDQAFSNTISDKNYRCEFIHRMRSAPLGWYLTKKTAGNMDISVMTNANKICEKLKPICTAN